MKTAKEYRTLAKEKVNSNSSLSIGTYLIFILIVAVCSVTAIGPIIITGPLTVGLIYVFTQIYKGENAKYEDIFNGFNKCFFNSFLTYLVKNIYIFLWTLLFYIPGIVKTYSYSMSLYIQNDNPELGFNECITRSRKMMDGHKMQLFLLHLSYIGWIILGALTFGILYIWILPKIQMAELAFYEDLKEEQNII